MAPRCPACDYVFERENGYFIGSATLGYLIGAISVVPTMVYGMLGLDYPVPWVVAAAGLQLCLLCPLLIRISRLLWIHFDYDADH